MIQKWIDRFKASREWNRALHRASLNQFDKAFISIQSAEKLAHRKNDGRITKFDVYLKLLKALILIQTHRFPEAKKNVLELEKIIKPNVSIERDYLRAYLGFLAEILQSKSPSEFIEAEYSSLLEIDTRNIVLSKIPDHLKKTFPLRRHPEWPKAPP